MCVCVCVLWPHVDTPTQTQLKQNSFAHWDYWLSLPQEQTSAVFLLPHLALLTPLSSHRSWDPHPSCPPEPGNRHGAPPQRVWQGRQICWPTGMEDWAYRYGACTRSSAWEFLHWGCLCDSPYSQAEGHLLLWSALLVRWVRENLFIYLSYMYTVYCLSLASCAWGQEGKT